MLALECILCDHRRTIDIDRDWRTVVSCDDCRIPLMAVDVFWVHDPLLAAHPDEEVSD